MADHHDHQVETTTNTASVDQITTAHLTSLLARFRSGRNEPLYISRATDPEAVIAPLLVTELLREYEQAAASHDGFDPLVIHEPIEGAAGESRPVNVAPIRRASTAFLTAQLERFARGDFQPFYLSDGGNAEAAILALELFDLFLAREKTAAAEDDEEIRRRISEIKRSHTAQTSMSFEEFLATVDEKTAALIDREPDDG